MENGVEYDRMVMLHDTTVFAAASYNSTRGERGKKYTWLNVADGEPFVPPENVDWFGGDVKAFLGF